jgi:hypothetical protein
VRFKSALVPLAVRERTAYLEAVSQAWMLSAVMSGLRLSPWAPNTPAIIPETADSGVACFHFQCVKRRKSVNIERKSVRVSTGQTINYSDQILLQISTKRPHQEMSY